jgi:hypothetical protein
MPGSRLVHFGKIADILSLLTQTVLPHACHQAPGSSAGKAHEIFSGQTPERTAQELETEGGAIGLPAQIIKSG